MDSFIRTNLDNLHAADKDAQNKAYTFLLDATEQPVDWAYEVWQELLGCLTDKDNRLRSIASQLLCNLACRSDPQGRMLHDFPALLAVTRDERFVTARHCLQALWKIGLAGREQREMVAAGLAGRFAECLSEKNCTLIRYDILEDLLKLYDQVKDETIKAKGLELIETEADLKYRKKYAALWRAA